MRLVLDTNVVTSAMLWGGLPRVLLEAGRERQVELFTSTALLAELTDILGRRKFAKRIAASSLNAEQFVDRYALLASLVRPMPIPRIAPDPDDDVVIGTGLAAKVDWIVTGDKQLLSVVQYEGIYIIRVNQAVEIINTGLFYKKTTHKTQTRNIFSVAQANILNLKCPPISPSTPTALAPPVTLALAAGVQ
jgi:uncharacterized protein